jgi:hypothetical protein
MPWADLGIERPERGWFLGLQLRLIDEDAGKTATVSWSDGEGLDPALWPELRLFSLDGNP